MRRFILHARCICIVVRHSINNKAIMKLISRTEFYVFYFRLPKLVLSSATLALGLWIRIPLCAWIYSYVYVSSKFVFSVDGGLTNWPTPRHRNLARCPKITFRNPEKWSPRTAISLSCHTGTKNVTIYKNYRSRTISHLVLKCFSVEEYHLLWYNAV
jgi:hypothetical protein